MADPNLLDILQAHGQQFLNSFSLPHSNNNVKKRKRTPDPSKSPQNEPTDNSDSTEEWTGIAEDDVALDISGSESLSECSDDFEQEDDDFTASTSAPDSKVIIFEESSKVSKLHQDIPGAPKKQVAEDQNEDDRTNAQNDAILHRLVHTKLLSGSLNPDLEMAPAKRRKALAGRVLEISGTVKLGKGEKSVREKERNKASKSVREGLIGKEKQRARQELEEVR
ncbi:hypothetical protein H0H81_000300 [Sphagnurus paluster]|uniref:Uncharacterized protein n=1 Tax=Sphagnurus paluster TaxID=117069 RepID=A0A9P7GHP3_9AGAR|nr:hypothetical protein H0H81_000300 [Sphagnurus paluster]